MESSSRSGAANGLWNSPRPQCSKEAQDLLRVIKEESRLTNLKRKEVVRSSEGEAALPRAVVCTDFVQRPPSLRPLRRSAESCQSGNSYEREMFRPGPARDLEKEKRRLQSIFATGKEESRVPKKPPASSQPEASEERDRYQEIMMEIEERKQFLADMAALGQEREYAIIINTQISQRIRELEQLKRKKDPE
ncbi:UPF0193 protein EVG1 isoform 1-T4 [Menidia menidia]